MGKIEYTVYLTKEDSYQKFISSTKVPASLQDQVAKFVSSNGQLKEKTDITGKFNVVNTLPSTWTVSYEASAGGPNEWILVNASFTTKAEVQYFKTNTLTRLISSRAFSSPKYIHPLKYDANKALEEYCHICKRTNPICDTNPATFRYTTGYR